MNMMFESVNYDFAVINTDVNKDGKIREINVIYFNSMFPKSRSTPYISENGDLSLSHENMIRITNEEPDDGFDEFFPVKVRGVGLTNFNEEMGDTALEFVLTRVAESSNIIIISKQSDIEVINNARFNLGLDGIDPDKWVLEDSKDFKVNMPNWIDKRNSWHKLLVDAYNLQSSVLWL